MDKVEVEIKAQVNNSQEVKEKILSMGAVEKEKKYQHDILLDPPETDFAKSDQVLRIRNSNGNWTLDYKTPRLDDETKSRKEFSLKIEDGKQLRDIFSWMDFKIVGEIEKEREFFELNNMLINFDKVTNLGTFIEVETIVNEDEFEEAKTKIFSLLKELNINETIKKDYLELLWEKGFFKKD